MRRALVAVMAMLLTGGWVAADGPQISFGTTSVVAEGITPGAQAAIFVVARRSYGNRLGVDSNLAVVTDSTSTGTVTWSWPEDVPRLTICAVVDLASGAVAVSTSPGLSRREFAPPHPFWSAQAPGLLRLAEARRQILQVLLARPGAGAWSLGVTRGGPHDAGGAADEHVSVRVDDLEPPRGGVANPGMAGHGDLVFVVDVLRMDSYLVRIP